MDAELTDEPFGYLTTTGRTSGQPRMVEMWFAVRGRTVYMLAGDGDGTHWVRNIAADPVVRFRVGDRELSGRGRLVTDPTEDRIARDAVFGKYQPGYGEDLSDWRATATPVAIDLG